LRYAELRKLQVAAAAEQCSGFILRHGNRAELETSPAALRLQLRAENNGALAVTILKQRGGNSGQTITIARPAALQASPMQDVPPVERRDDPERLLAIPAQAGTHAVPIVVDSRLRGNDKKLVHRYNT
jgi:hypothetical protein